MNLNRFRRSLIRHAAIADWTGKKRLAYSVWLRLSDITTPERKQLAGRVWNYVQANQCPAVGFSSCDNWLVMGAGITAGRKSSSLWLAGYGRIAHRQLRASGIGYKIKPTAAALHIKHPQCTEMYVDFNRFDTDQAYRATVQAYWREQDDQQDAYAERLIQYGIPRD